MSEKFSGYRTEIVDDEPTVENIAADVGVEDARSDAVLAGGAETADTATPALTIPEGITNHGQGMTEEAMDKVINAPDIPSVAADHGVTPETVNNVADFIALQKEKDAEDAAKVAAINKSIEGMMTAQAA